MPADGQGNCAGTREQAAKALVDWIATDPTGSGDRDYLILGDLNSYAMEDSVDAIKAGPDDTPGTADDFTNLIAKYQGPFAHSYVFDGQAGLPRPCPRQRDARRPGHRRRRLAHQLRRARHPRLRHDVQAAGPGGALRGRTSTGPRTTTPSWSACSC